MTEGGRPPRIRRQRSATESLVQVACILEAVVLFFIALAIFGLRALPAGLALGGGGAGILLFLVAAGVARWKAGLVFGGLLQVAFLVVSFVQIAAVIVAVVFVALWVYCLVRGIQLDRANARRADGIEGEV